MASFLKAEPEFPVEQGVQKTSHSRLKNAFVKPACMVGLWTNTWRT